MYLFKALSFSITPAQRRKHVSSIRTIAIEQHRLFNTNPAARLDNTDSQIKRNHEDSLKALINREPGVLYHYCNDDGQPLAAHLLQNPQLLTLATTTCESIGNLNRNRLFKLIFALAVGSGLIMGVRMVAKYQQPVWPPYHNKNQLSQCLALMVSMMPSALTKSTMSMLTALNQVLPRASDYLVGSSCAVASIAFVYTKASDDNQWLAAKHHNHTPLECYLNSCTRDLVPATANTIKQVVDQLNQHYPHALTPIAINQLSVYPEFNDEVIKILANVKWLNTRAELVGEDIVAISPFVAAFAYGNGQLALALFNNFDHQNNMSVYDNKFGNLNGEVTTEVKAAVILSKRNKNFHSYCHFNESPAVKDIIKKYLEEININVLSAFLTFVIGDKNDTINNADVEQIVRALISLNAQSADDASGLLYQCRHHFSPAYFQELDAKHQLVIKPVLDQTLHNTTVQIGLSQQLLAQQDQFSQALSEFTALITEVTSQTGESIEEVLITLQSLETAEESKAEVFSENQDEAKSPSPEPLPEQSYIKQVIADYHSNTQMHEAYNIDIRERMLQIYERRDQGSAIGKFVDDVVNWVVDHLAAANIGNTDTVIFDATPKHLKVGREVGAGLASIVIGPIATAVKTLYIMHQQGHCNEIYQTVRGIIANANDQQHWARDSAMMLAIAHGYFDTSRSFGLPSNSDEFNRLVEHNGLLLIAIAASKNIKLINCSDHNHRVRLTCQAIRGLGRTGGLDPPDPSNIEQATSFIKQQTKTLKQRYQAIKNSETLGRIGTVIHHRIGGIVHTNAKVI